MCLFRSDLGTLHFSVDQPYAIEHGEPLSPVVPPRSFERRHWRQGGGGVTGKGRWARAGAGAAPPRAAVTR